MVSNKTVTSLLAALVLPIAALAGEDINYTFLDMQYTNNGIDESYTETWPTESMTIEFDGGGGFAALASLALHDNWHVFTRYAATDLDLHIRTTVDDMNMSQSFAGDVNDWRLGLGFNIAVTPNLDTVVQLAWDSRKVELGSISIDDEEEVSLDVDDDGFAIMAGLRGNIGEKIELNGHVQYSEVLSVDLAAETEEDVLDSDVRLGVGGVYQVNDTFSIGANVESGDSTAWCAFARVGFGRS